MNYPYFSPYPQQPIIPTMQPSQVVKVSGENGARAFNLGANSSALLLDETGLLVWLVTTDGAGYKTVTPYDIKPHQAAPSPDFATLENRIKKLEEMVNGNFRNTSANSKGESQNAAD